ncbi:hypothetical protein NKH54_00555 [Mesorhizobium sp. M1004]|uniref:hypothetical protein n=1 Tax=Mesorhizobium sp. M1004 TaxID=2957046 RepID=UPI00333BDB36
MLGLLDWIKLGVGAAAGAVLAAAVVYPVAHWKGDTQGYNRRVAEVAAADLKAELERKGDNAKLNGMSDFNLCVSGLRGNGLPVDACEQLRGVSIEQPEP